MADPYLSDEHRAYLEAHAVDPDQALAAGHVRSLLTRDDLAQIPSEWQAGIGRYIPENGGLLFVWTGPTGAVNVQLRPDEDKRPLDESGEPMKYVYQAKRPPVLWAVREVENPVGVILPEGSKQCLVAARYAPEGYSVYGMAGCWGFREKDGDASLPIPDLEVVDGLPVKVILDADFTTNPNVWRAADQLQAALKAEGAELIEWVKLPAGGKAGLDDYLAKRTHERRARVFGMLLSEASAKNLPNRAPTAPRKKDGPPKPPKPTGDRAVVVVSGDPLNVINEISSGMAVKFSGTRLFCHGDHISELVTADRKPARLEPVDSGRFGDVLQQAVQTVREVVGRDGSVSYVPAWPDQKAMAAVLSRVEAFAPLTRLATAPFVRADGTVVTEPGYDPDSEVMLMPDGELAGLEIPEHPSMEEVATARKLILEDWLGDFPFETQADRANALALILTPTIRGLVDVVPLAVLDGSRMGVGKGKVVETMLWVYTGRSAPLTSMPENEELRKKITASFREGRQFMIFDEAHTVEGEALAQALTASIWEDRILGVSKNGTFPNTATWVSLGNNVEVKGDITRRAYRISLKPNHDDPENRPADSFRHPNLERWVRENRRELLAAVLTLARAWFAAGKPRMPRPAVFGSFTEWELVVGGILSHAGVPDFLVGREEWAKGSSPESDWWAGHFFWLSETFGTEGFTVQDVVNAARKNPERFQGPPGLLKPHDEAFPGRLPYAYRSQKGRPEAGMVLDHIGTARGKVTRWTLRTESRFSSDSSSPPGGDGGDGGDVSALTYGSKTAMRLGDDTATGDQARCTPRESGEEMSSISSIPSGPPVDWVPSNSGDTVAGRVIELSKVEDDFAGDFPVAVLRTRTGLVRITGSPPFLRRALADAAPEVGDAIVVKFLGERPINGDPHRKAGQYRVVKKTGAA
ncbi:DUF3854 domain-containing protein [Micromonospora halophytica]|uniref:Uncharacterized protein n=1 Tax=Micromonospora halophytica TaxID=47864 RepID=A0A1C5J099_9ACTN|nr:DUF3854 domain-containing protein [Micromonospora halophytica]SCG63994.1 protein of unknown function [Micromonospora halophytica]